MGAGADSLHKAKRRKKENNERSHHKECAKSRRARHGGDGSRISGDRRQRCRGTRPTRAHSPRKRRRCSDRRNRHHGARSKKRHRERSRSATRRKSRAANAPSGGHRRRRAAVSRSSSSYYSEYSYSDYYSDLDCPGSCQSPLPVRLVPSARGRREAARGRASEPKVARAMQKIPGSAERPDSCAAAVETISKEGTARSNSASKNNRAIDTQTIPKEVASAPAASASKEVPHATPARLGATIAAIAADTPASSSSVQPVDEEREPDAAVSASTEPLQTEPAESQETQPVAPTAADILMARGRRGVVSAALAVAREGSPDGEDVELKPSLNVVLGEPDPKPVSQTSAARPEEEDAASEDAGQRRFAWMDSADEASDSAAEEAPGCPEAVEAVLSETTEALVDARQVDTLGQMLRLAESLEGQKDLVAPRLVDICAAAARVRFYDPALFQETLAPSLLQRFCGGISDDAAECHFSIEQALEVIRALSELNAASALSEIFVAAAKALRECGERLSSQQRKMIKEIYATAGRERDVTFLTFLVPNGDENMAKPTGSIVSGFNSDGLPMRPGQRICENYFKNGNCKSGNICRMDHPESLRLQYNSEGFPLRPWVPTCHYYMRMGTCDYRKTCKWHHPEKKERQNAAAWIPKPGAG